MLEMPRVWTFRQRLPIQRRGRTGKDDGWNQIKRHKPRKTGGPSSKGQPSIQHTSPPSGNRFDPLSSQQEKTQDAGIQKESEPTEEIGKIPDSSSKGTPPASNKDVNDEIPKSKNDEDNEEEQIIDDSEEGEIGESQASVRRSTRGRKTDREKREEETYKEKLQGSRPTLEKLLASKPRMSKSQPHGSKGAHQKHK